MRDDDVVELVEGDVAYRVVARHLPTHARTLLEDVLERRPMYGTRIPLGDTAAVPEMDDDRYYKWMHGARPLGEEDPRSLRRALPGERRRHRRAARGEDAPRHAGERGRGSGVRVLNEISKALLTYYSTCRALLRLPGTCTMVSGHPGGAMRVAVVVLAAGTFGCAFGEKHKVRKECDNPTAVSYTHLTLPTICSV